KSRDDTAARRSRQNHVADRDHAVPRVQSRPHHRGGFRRADRAARHRDADHRSFREARQGDLIMAQVSLRNLRKQYGATTAVENVSFDIAEGELVAFLGPSGCGKTTTLRMVAGFIEPTEGEIWIGNSEVTRLAPDKRNTGMVFQ